MCKKDTHFLYPTLSILDFNIKVCYIIAKLVKIKLLLNQIQNKFDTF